MSRQQSGALLAYLALNPGRTYHREELLALLWPEDDSEEGRRKLRQSLYSLRRLLRPGPSFPDPFLSSRDTLGLSPEWIVTDLAEFECLLDRAGTVSSCDRAETLRHAVVLYRGDLLAGFYQEAFTSERGRVAARYRAAMQDRVRALEASGDLSSAIGAARDIVAMDPLVEEAHVDLMRLYAAAGRPSEVRRQYRELAAVLEAELGVAPAESTRAQAERLSAAAEMDAPVAMPMLPQDPLPARDAIPHHDAKATWLPPQPWARAAAIALLCILVVTLLMARDLLRQPARPAPTNRAFRFADGQLLVPWRVLPQKGDRDSEPSAILCDRDGYIYVGGFVQTLDHDDDILVSKYDPNGLLIWPYRYNGDKNDVDRLTAMAIDPKGNVYFTGETLGKTGQGNGHLKELNFITVKLDPKGHEVWKAPYNGPADGRDSPADIALGPDGSVYVCGTSWDGTGSANAVVVLKYGPDGKQQWVYRRRPTGRDERAVNMALASDGVYVAARSTSIGTPGITDGYLLKLSLRGEKEWIQPVRTRSEGLACAPRVVVDSSQSPYFVVEVDGGKEPGGATVPRALIIRYRPDGHLQWRSGAFSKPGDRPSDLQPDPRGGVVVAGEPGPPSYKVLLAGIAPDGTTRYERRELGWDPGGTPRRVVISVDENGNVAATGSSFSDIHGPRATDYDAISLFLNVGDGTGWKAQYDGPDHQRDHGMAVTTRNGRYYAAVQSTEGGVSTIHILKYSVFPKLEQR